MTANISTIDPQGVVFIGLQNQWLQQTNVEIIDTPGAGDLSYTRARLVNDALLCGDGAIITISALNALSTSEELFIKERLVSQKTPHLMLVVTRLDQVKEKDRLEMIEYIQDKLKLWEINIPVFITQDNLNITVPGVSVGIKAVKEELERWVSDKEHNKLKTQNICVSLIKVLEIAASALSEKEKLQLLGVKEKAQVLEDKKMQIAKLQLIWEDLRIEMLSRCNQCYDWLRTTVMEKNNLLIERLQYEVSHTNTPQKW